jgi:hypothetical protein
MIVNVTGLDNNASGADGGGGENTTVTAINTNTITLSAALLSDIADGTAIAFTTPGSRQDNFAMAGDGTLSGGDILAVTFKISAENASTQVYANTFPTDGNALKFQSNPATATSVAQQLMIRINLVHNGTNSADAGATTSATPDAAADADAAHTNDTGDSELNNA